MIKCTGCRKKRYYLRHWKIKAPFGNNEPLKSVEKLCIWCGWKLKRLTKKLHG